jgi:hypothetical protein
MNGEPNAVTAQRGRAELQDFRSRVRGCLPGGAIGDALGAGVDSESLAELRGPGRGAGGPGHHPQLADDFAMEMTQGPALHSPGSQRGAWLRRYPDI